MAHQCDLYFFVKLSWRKKRKLHILRTVIWNLGRKEGLDRAAAAKRLKVGVTQSLALSGFLSWFLEAQVHHVLLPGLTAPEAIALLDDPAFTFKDDALAISLHCASVAMTDEVEPDPFCTATP
jgi:hypothetical protein